MNEFYKTQSAMREFTLAMEEFNRVIASTLVPELKNLAYALDKVMAPYIACRRKILWRRMLVASLMLLIFCIYLSSEVLT